jgi:hypothetical protein
MRRRRADDREALPPLDYDLDRAGIVHDRDPNASGVEVPASAISAGCGGEHVERRRSR